MRLNELFQDTKVNVKWQNRGGMMLGYFEYNDNQYVIQFIKLSQGDHITSKLPDEKLTNNSYFFAFALANDGAFSDTLTGLGNPIPIISIILQELNKFVLKNKVDCLYFGCSDGNQKLKALYARLCQVYSRKNGWNIDNIVTASFFGDTKRVWIVSKL